MRYPYEDYDHLPAVGTGRRTTLNAPVRPKLVERIPRPDDYDRATDRSDRELDALRDAELDDWFGRYDA